RPTSIPYTTLFRATSRPTITSPWPSAYTSSVKKPLNVTTRSDSALSRCSLPDPAGSPAQDIKVKIKPNPNAKRNQIPDMKLKFCENKRLRKNASRAAHHELVMTRRQGQFQVHLALPVRCLILCVKQFPSQHIIHAHRSRPRHDPIHFYGKNPGVRIRRQLHAACFSVKIPARGKIRQKCF